MDLQQKLIETLSGTFIFISGSTWDLLQCTRHGRVTITLVFIIIGNVEAQEAASHPFLGCLCIPHHQDTFS